MSATSPEEITAAALARFAGTPDARLRDLMQALIRHLHAFATETGLTAEEWLAGIEFLTRAGQISTGERQELILLSDTLGLSMALDALHHPSGTGATESTVLGPFYVAGSPERPFGGSIVEQPGSGDPGRARRAGRPRWRLVFARARRGAAAPALSGGVPLR